MLIKDYDNICFRYRDVSQDLIDNEFVVETEYDGFLAVDGFSEPLTDLDFSSPQP
jgi:hypothetical protein